MKHVLFFAVALTGSVSHAEAGDSQTRDWQGNVCASGSVTSISSLRGKAECSPVKGAKPPISNGARRFDEMIEQRGNDFFNSIGLPIKGGGKPAATEQQPAVDPKTDGPESNVCVPGKAYVVDTLTGKKNCTPPKHPRPITEGQRRFDEMIKRKGDEFFRRSDGSSAAEPPKAVECNPHPRLPPCPR